MGRVPPGTTDSLALLSSCPLSLVPVTEMALAAASEWRRRIGERLTAWLCGYPLHLDLLEAPPRQHHAPANRIDRSNQLEVAWVEREFRRLQSIGALAKVASRPARLYPIRVVPKKGPKLFRLVVNMRSLNRHLKPVGGRYEDIRAILARVEKGSWFISLDITDAYFLVSMAEEASTWLGVSWQGSYYVYRALPFGCSSSPGVFTSIVSALVDYWRTLSVCCSSFYDDIFACHLRKAICSAYAAFLRTEARTLGITFDFTKGNPEPTQQGVVLGFLLDTTSLTVAIPPAGLAKIHGKADRMVVERRATMRQLYSLASSLMAYKRAAMLSTPRAYALYAACASRGSWDTTFSLTEETIDALLWIRDSLPQHAVRRFNWEASEIVAFKTDASGIGCGMVQVDPISLEVSGEEMRTAFSVQERALSSNNRELRCLPRGVLAFSETIRGKAVQFYSDNTTAISYAYKGGGPVRELNALALRLLETLHSLGADLLPPRHIPGKLNVEADLASRQPEMEDYRLRSFTFLKLAKKWGGFSVDLFADDFNTLLPAFYSRWRCPQAAAVDAFSQRWQGSVYLFPPPSMLERVVAKILGDGCSGLLIASRSLRTAAVFDRLEPFIREEMALQPRDLLPGTSSSPVPWTDSSGPVQWTAVRFDAARS